jgi:hypothetical protein
MQIILSGGEDDTTAIESIVSDIDEEFSEASIETEVPESEERLFPGLEDPVVQKIIVVASFEVTKRAYTELKSRIEALDAQIHLSAADIEQLKWELIEAETGLTDDELEVTGSHTPEETGELWIYEFIDQDGKQHQLKIQADNLDFEYKEVK